MFIRVRVAKGQKDRTTLLSKTCLAQLRRYWIEYKPENYLFPDQNGAAYSPSSLRQVFNRAKWKAGLDNDYTVHTLRHSPVGRQAGLPRIYWKQALPPGTFKSKDN